MAASRPNRPKAPELWRHRRAIGNPRYGIVVVGVLPYTTIVEGFGPLLEVSGYVVTTAAALLGVLNWSHYRVLVAVSVLFGAAATLLAVLLSDVATRRYNRGRDLALLVAVATMENIGYRQLNASWGCVGTVQALTGKGGWGRCAAAPSRATPPDPRSAPRRSCDRRPRRASCF
jgi:hypothetical protein